MKRDAGDDTPVDMLQEGRGRTKEARMWVYVGDCGPPYRFFDFTEDRRKERPGQILSRYAGFVQADAYAGYDHLFAHSDRIVEVGCWAHARRKWDEALDTARLPCTDVLLRIRALYKVEAAIRGEKPELRLEVRQGESVPLLDKLYARLAEIATERVILPSSLLAKAVGYATNQRQALYRYTTDGRLESDTYGSSGRTRPRLAHLSHAWRGPACPPWIHTARPIATTFPRLWPRRGAVQAEIENSPDWILPQRTPRPPSRLPRFLHPRFSFPALLAELLSDRRTLRRLEPGAHVTQAIAESAAVGDRHPLNLKAGERGIVGQSEKRRQFVKRVEALITRRSYFRSASDRIQGSETRIVNRYAVQPSAQLGLARHQFRLAHSCPLSSLRRSVRGRRHLCRAGA